MNNWHVALSVGLLACSFVSAAEQTGNQLDDVIVTARRRAENAQQVPVSVTDYSGEELRAQSLERLSDVGQMTPNLLYSQKVQSGSSAGELYIRGVGQQDTQMTFNPSVGIFVDGIYLARPTADDLEMADVARLEVLYGPQGTLFGKNTNGGAINIVTRLPDLELGAPAGDLQVQTGDYHRFDAQGRLEVSVVPEIAALELSLSRRTQSGYSQRLNGSEQADENRDSGRAQLRIKLSEDLEATLRLDRARFDEYSSAYKLVAVRSGSAIPVLYSTLTPYRYDDRWLTASDFSYAGTGPNRNEGSVWGTSLTVDWKQPWGNMKSLSAYRRLRVESDFDPDGSPLAVLDVFNQLAQHQISQELQASGNTSVLDWAFGLYYFRETADDDQPANVGLEYFQGSANFDPRLHVINQDFAAYGQATLALSPRVALTLGARAGNDRADVSRIQVDYPVPTVEQPLVWRSASWNSFLPRAGLSYQWTGDLMLYVSAAQGSKTGGFNGRAGSIAEFNRYDPEKVWTYEMGLRSDWLERRVRFNATAFYSRYNDFQILLNRSVTVDGIPAPFSFVGNMPRASIRGGELALSGAITPGLKLSAGLGITRGRYEEILPGAPVTLDSQFVNTPEYAFTLGAEYSIALPNRNRLTVHSDYSHKSTIQFDYGNSPLVRQGPYGVLNGRVTLQLANPAVSLFLFGTNLADVHYAVGGIDDGATGSLGEVVEQMGPPREWGVGGRYEF